MSENDDTGRDIEDAAAEGALPGVEAADTAEEDGRDPSGTEDAVTDDDAPAGGVVMGAINQH
jgi:hypothetical protein